MRLSILLLILGMAAVTFLPRFVPLALFTRWSLPERIKRALHFMPTAIMAAIVFPILFSSPEGKIAFEPRLILAALPVFPFAYRFKNLWGSVALGMVLYWALGFAFR
jgi:branched-subunit amino acid transport protein